MKIDYYFIVNIERDKVTELIKVLNKSISRKVLLAKEIYLVSSNSRASESLILAKISEFLFVLTIADKEIMKSSLSAEES